MPRHHTYKCTAVSFSSTAIKEMGEWSCNCKQWIVQLYFKQKISNGRIVNVLVEERLKVFKKPVWTTVFNYKARGTLSCLLGSSGRFKLALEVLNIIEAQMQVDNETTAT